MNGGKLSQVGEGAWPWIDIGYSVGKGRCEIFRVYNYINVQVVNIIYMIFTGYIYRAYILYILGLYNVFIFKLHLFT